MKKSIESCRRLIAVGSLIILAAGVNFGCETRVVGAKGIGASSSHPTTEQRAGSDPLSEKVWGSDPQR